MDGSLEQRVGQNTVRVQVSAAKMAIKVCPTACEYTPLSLARWCCQDRNAYQAVKANQMRHIMSIRLLSVARAPDDLF